MTAIAAIATGGRVFMGGDRAAVAQSHYLSIAEQPKVFVKGDLVIGYTSSFRMGHALEHRLTVPANLPAADDLAGLDRWLAVDFTDAVRSTLSSVGYLKKDSEREEGGVFLVGVRGQIYYFDDDFHALRRRFYAACGSGETACLAALFMAEQSGRLHIEPRTVLAHALRAAESCIATVRGPFDIVEGGAA